MLLTLQNRETPAAAGLPRPAPPPPSRAGSRAPLFVAILALLLLGTTFYNAASTTSDIMRTIKPPATAADDDTAAAPRSRRMRDAASIKPPSEQQPVEQPLEQTEEAPETDVAEEPAEPLPVITIPARPVHKREDPLARAVSEASIRVCPPAEEGILAGGLHLQLQDLAAYLATACRAAPFGAAVQLPAFASDGDGESGSATGRPLPFAEVFDVEVFARAASSLCRVVAAPAHAAAATAASPAASGPVLPPAAALEAFAALGTVPDAAALAAANAGVDAGACSQRLRQTGNAIAARAVGSSGPAAAGARPLSPYPFTFRALVYRGLALSPQLQAVADACAAQRDALWGGRGKPFLAVHVRVESDWQARCAELEAGFPGLRACFSPSDVARIVQRRFPRHAGLRRVLVLGALDRAPPDALAGPSSVFEAWGPQTRVYSAHSRCFAPGGPGAGLSSTQEAAVETFLAVGADDFIGTAASSFSYGVAMIRAQQQVQKHARKALGAVADAGGGSNAGADAVGTDGGVGDGAGGSTIAPLPASSWSYFCPPPAGFPGAREQFMPWEAAHVSKYLPAPPGRPKKGHAQRKMGASFALPYSCIE